MTSGSQGMLGGMGAVDMVVICLYVSCLAGAGFAIGDTVYCEDHARRHTVTKVFFWSIIFAGSVVGVIALGGLGSVPFFNLKDMSNGTAIALLIIAAALIGSGYYSLTLVKDCPKGTNICEGPVGGRVWFARAVAMAVAVLMVRQLLRTAWDRETGFAPALGFT